MDMQIFNHDQFGQVRVVKKDDDPWFVAKDVAEVLGYVRSRDAIAMHCKGAVKHRILTDGGVQEMSIIPERDVYRLIMRSQLPGAEKFEEWVVGEVLPSVRKHGAYITPAKVEEILNDPDTMIKMCNSLKAEREKTRKQQEIIDRQSSALIQQNKMLDQQNAVIASQSEIIYQQNKQLKEQRRKVVFADLVMMSEDTISVGTLAKFLYQSGVKIGPNQLFALLRNQGYLFKTSRHRNKPSRESIEKGLIKTSYTKTPCITGNGQVYFINLLKDLHQKGQLIVPKMQRKKPMRFPEILKEAEKVLQEIENII